MSLLLGMSSSVALGRTRRRGSRFWSEAVVRGFKGLLFAGRTGDGWEEAEDWGERGGERAREGWVRVGCAFGLCRFLD